MLIGTVHSITANEYIISGHDQMAIDCTVEINGRGWHLVVEHVPVSTGQKLEIDGQVQIEQGDNRTVTLSPVPE